MKLKKCFQLDLNILLHSRLRSWLTILGIFIGIASVVSIISISEGAQQQLESRLGGLGADILTITPGGFSRAMGSGGRFRDMPGGNFGINNDNSNKKNLTSKDILVIKSLENVDVVMGQVSGRAELSYLSKSATLSIVGVDSSSWGEITTETLLEGRFLTMSDSYSVVLGGNIVSRTFEDEILLNSKITIEGKSFRVVGILESSNSVYMPIDLARILLDDVGENEFASISVKIKDISIVEETINLIEEKLRMSRGILYEKDQDFSVSNPAEMQETIQETMQTMSLFLGAIAAISLLVGGIGIANTMFTSVLEKTKEIGVMKAIGAKNKDILFIFLFNSGLIGLVGGIGGIILGIFGSSLIGSYTSNLGGGGMQGGMFGNTVITPELLIGALLFSVIIGIIAGVIPAYRASKLSPVEALRYE